MQAVVAGFIRVVTMMPCVQLADEKRQRIEQGNPFHLDAETIRPVGSVIHPRQSLEDFDLSRPAIGKLDGGDIVSTQPGGSFRVTETNPLMITPSHLSAWTTAFAASRVPRKSMSLLNIGVPSPMPNAFAHAPTANPPISTQSANRQHLATHPPHSALAKSANVTIRSIGRSGLFS